MATLVLMIGLPGSGKTTLAKRMERERAALRLTPDQWVTALHGPDPSPAVLDAAREPVEVAQWRIAERALALGLDVVLDFGGRRGAHSIRNTLCCACSSSRPPAIPHHTVSANVTATASSEAQVHDTGVGSPWGSCMYIATVTRR